MKTISQTQTLYQAQNRIALLGTTSLLVGALLSTNVQADAMTADFNGDGLEDLVVGMPYEDFGNLLNAGAVKVVYGRDKAQMGTLSKTAYLHQYRAGIGGITLAGSAEKVDIFGDQIAVGDFNDDGYDDIAIGVKYKQIGNVKFAGIVNIAYGSSEGLASANNHTLDLQKYENGKYSHKGNMFGIALSVGDHNGDGIDDLAVGFLAPHPDGENDENLHGGGAITFYGKNAIGLKLAEYSPETRIMVQYRYSDFDYNNFGGRLTSGDFNGNGIDDLAIGAILDDIKLNYNDDVNGEIRNAGSVKIQYGVADWHTTHSVSPIIKPTYKYTDGNFGYAMAATDLNRDGRDELIIGAPGSSFSGITHSGAVAVVKIQSNGQITQQWYQRNQSIFSGSAKVNDKFGYALTIADFDDDGDDDLAVGVPYRDKSSWWPSQRIDNYGEVLVMYNNTWGGFHKSEVWHQDVSGVAGIREANDRFGTSLSTGDFNKDGIADLLVGTPNEDIGSITDAGSVQLIWGYSNGLTTSFPGTQLFHQGSFTGWGFGSGVSSTENEAYDQFGRKFP